MSNKEISETMEALNKIFEERNIRNLNIDWNTNKDALNPPNTVVKISFNIQEKVK